MCTPTTERVARPGLRVNDADRERVAEQIRTAVGEGRLTLVEAEERQAAAYEARVVADLDPLVADLPAPPLRRQPLDADARRRLRIATVAAVGLMTLWVVSNAPFFFPGPLLFLLVVSLLVHRQVRRRHLRSGLTSEVTRSR